MAAGEDTVKRFHQAALAAGGYDEGAPGLRPHYAADYYAAYVRDPDGNKLQAVYYANERKAGLAGDSISHITLGTRDVARAGRFYEAVLATLGLVRLAGEEEQGEDAAFGFKDTGVPIVFPQKTFDGRPATWGNGTHVAFQAANRAAVDAFYRAALSLGGLDEGAPALRPHYHTDYYAAYVRDPDGNKLQAVCHEQHRPI
jgi:catechol 2,3-dioxygenase-like lactoylglutathione lyase family enzyme